jgi:hypothetical protein
MHPQLLRKQGCGQPQRSPPMAKLFTALSDATVPDPEVVVQLTNQNQLLARR